MVLDQETGTTGVSAVGRKIVFHDKLPDYDARNQEIGLWLMADVISRVRKKHASDKSTYKAGIGTMSRCWSHSINQVHGKFRVS